ncbi:MAG TPA: TonB-dependent receptor, partial [Salinimicrobium sp.]|nr:TonB-dependent receptor [Salinimicrobium sp.]
MTRLLSFMLILFAVATTQAQTGNIKGKIKGKVISVEGSPLFGVNVLLKNTTYGTATKNDGSFLLKDIPVGKYTLRVSFVGFQTKEREVWVREGETTNLGAITLEYSQQNLESVVINGEEANKYTEKSSVYVSKMPLEGIDNPQVYSSITAELLEEQVITNFDDALKNVPGITKLWESTGRGGDGAGYFSLRGFPVQPTLVNGLPAITNGSPDPANIARIEVVKGPSGTLYGSSLISYGGLINIVTKKPYETFGGSISYTTGSYGLNRVAADINAPLADGVALRLNTAYHNQNSFQDQGFQKSFFLAPSLSYEVNDKLSFLVNTEFYWGESTNPTMLFVDRGTELIVHNMDELDYNNNRSYTSNDITIKNPTYSLQGQMIYELSDNWTSQTAISRGSAKAIGLYSYLYETSQYYSGNSGDEPIYEVELNDGVVFTRYTSHQNSTTLTTDIQQNFIGDFEIGGMQNKMVVGLDYYTQKIINASTGYTANGNIYIGNAGLENVNASVYGITDEDNYITDGDSGILSEAHVLSLLANSPINTGESQIETYSAYVSDVINFTPKLSAMLSLRIDQFESEDNSQTALSPKFGVVYQPIDDKVALFANYMDGFSNVAPRQEGDPTNPAIPTTTVTFEPEHAKQFEVGTKLNLLNDRLVASLSYYNIQVSNIVMERADKPFFYVQDGEKYSRGIEASL